MQYIQFCQVPGRISGRCVGFIGSKKFIISKYIISEFSSYGIFFFFNFFGGTEVPIVHILLCRHSEDSLQGSAFPDGSPSKDWQSTVGWGDCWIQTQNSLQYISIYIYSYILPFQTENGNFSHQVIVKANRFLVC